MDKVALISVSDKTGVAELGRGLARLGWTVLSTGGTAERLREAGCSVTAVAEHTGFPEVLGGRVKTLHPRVFAGILARPGDEDATELQRHEIPPIDLVVVNLYPFRETVERDGVTADEAVEQIDIGGPSLLRAAAKNHERVTVVVNPDDYGWVLDKLERGGTDAEDRQRLALAAFRHTAAYDAAISSHLAGLLGTDDAPEAAAAERLLGSESLSLRYGENPHQWGRLARPAGGGGLGGAEQLQGKEISFNNLGDASGAWRLVWDLPGPAAVVVKHANPCGVAVGDDPEQTFRAARGTDPMSAFGGVIATTHTVDEGVAEAVVEAFAEVVIGPAFTDEALQVLARKKNLRVLRAGAPVAERAVIRSIDGGFLLQEPDVGWDREERRVVTDAAPDAEQENALELAWRVVKHVASNAVVVGVTDRIIGIGAGQMSRVDAAKVAVMKAEEFEHPLAGSVAASDAFFPFPDGIEALADKGVRAVIQPGGSIRDEKVIAACNELGVAMVFTGHRHFRHA